MVDRKTSLRRDISFAEMADLARKYAANPENRRPPPCRTPFALLYASAGRQKRNYIGHFANAARHHRRPPHLPEAIPRSLGLQTRKSGLTTDARLARRLVDALSAMPMTSAAKEVELLRSFAVPPAKVQTGESSRPGKPSAKTSLRFEGPGGMVRCTAPREGSKSARRGISPRSTGMNLEAALEVFFQALDG